jgi:hypothetical protein
VIELYDALRAAGVARTAQTARLARFHVARPVRVFDSGQALEHEALLERHPRRAWPALAPRRMFRAGGLAASGFAKPLVGLRFLDFPSADSATHTVLSPCRYERLSGRPCEQHAAVLKPPGGAFTRPSRDYAAPAPRTVRLWRSGYRDRFPRESR